MLYEILNNSRPHDLSVLVTARLKTGQWELHGDLKVIGDGSYNKPYTYLQAIKKCTEQLEQVI